MASLRQIVIVTIMTTYRTVTRRLVVRCGLDKRHAYRRLAALAAVSRDAAVAPKLGYDFRIDEY